MASKNFQGEQYKTYCVECGNVISADQLCFDFRMALLQYAQEIMTGIDLNSDEFAWKEDWKTQLEDMKVPILLNNVALEKGFQLFESPTDNQLILYAADVRRILAGYLGIADWDDANTELEVYQSICHRFGEFPHETWVSLCRLFREHENEIVFKGTLERQIKKNDRGIAFAGGFNVTLPNHHVVRIPRPCCEHCGTPLLEEAGIYEEIVIGMMGSARVGKTAYLAALMHALKEGRAIGTQMSGKSSIDFSKKILAPYESGEKILKTELTADDIPLFSHKIYVGDRTFIFTFVDMPGEVFVQDEDDQGEGEGLASAVMDKRQVLKNVRAVWLCLDPSQFKSELADFIQDEQADRVITNLDIVVANSINTYNQIRVKGDKVPAAVMVTKCDMLQELDVFYPEKEKGTQLEKRYLFGDVSGDMPDEELTRRTPEFWVQANSMDINPFYESFIASVDPALTRSLTESFFINYFPVAAYGHEVDRGNPQPPQPSGVRLPFYWTLAALGLLQPMEEVEIHVTEKYGLFHMKSRQRIDYADREADPKKLYRTI